MSHRADMATTPRPTHIPRRIAVALVLALVGLAAFAPAGAGAAAPAAAPQARCDLRDPNLSPHDEWGQCFTVDASLSEAPAQGEAATLSYRIRSATTRPDAKV